MNIQGTGGSLPMSGLALANVRRTTVAAARQVTEAAAAVAVLSAVGDPDYQRWIDALELRVRRPQDSLRQLAGAMTPPMSKDRYSALLRRAIRRAQEHRTGRVGARPKARFDNGVLRASVLALLADGDVLTTSELRNQLVANGYGLAGLSNDVLYRQLSVLRGRGQARHLGRRGGGGRDVWWARAESGAPASGVAVGESSSASAAVVDGVGRSEEQVL